MNPPKFRAVAFGANRFGVGLVTPMPTIEACGLYIHADDIGEFIKAHPEFIEKTEDQDEKHCEISGAKL